MPGLVIIGGASRQVELSNARMSATPLGGPGRWLQASDGQGHDTLRKAAMCDFFTNKHRLDFVAVQASVELPSLPMEREV